MSKNWTLERVPGALVQAKLRNLLILLPVDNRPSAVRRQAADLVASVAQLTGRPVHAAQSYRPTLAELPDAATEASEILTLVSAIPDATSRPYVIDELLVELAIAHRPDIAQGLSDLPAACSRCSQLKPGSCIPRTLLVLARTMIR